MSAEHEIDKIVRDAFFPDRKDGVLIEVGAARPDYLSISASFRRLGWKIVSIEPNPHFCAEHRQRGYDILQYACGDRDEDDVAFTIVNSHGADYLGGNVSYESFSSLGIEGKFAELFDQVKARTSVETIPVKVRRLDTILAAHEPELANIDILAVDVEGWELSVMRGLTKGTLSPKVAILENLFADIAYHAYMEARGYKLWKSLAHNEIYVRA
jgi:FkbM family methyltransferase